MHKTVTITTADVGSTTFQFAFFFTGNSYNVDYWYIDNVKLYTPFQNDLAIMSVPGAEHVEANVPITPSCEVKNVGVSTLTAVVSLDIYQHETLLQSYPGYFSQSLAANATATASFPAFTPELENELYRFVFTISSLEDVVDEDLSNNVKEKAMNTWTGAKQNVLLEIGTGGWCQYCPGAAMAADHFIEENLNVAVIENHNGDPYATDTSNGRNSYYGISGFPTGIFDGLLSYVGGNNTTSIFPAYQPLYNQRVGIKTPVAIDMYGSHDGLSYSVYVNVNKLANLAYENLVLHLAITQSDIQYSWQGQTEFNFVNMMMVPDRFGTTVDLKNAPLGVMTVPLNFTAATAWNLANCEFVAFVQNLDTKEVLQAYKVMVNDLPTGGSAIDDGVSPALQNCLLGNYPNPFSPSTTISYTSKGDAPVAIEIYNVKGQLVKSMVDNSKTVGTHELTWNGTDTLNRPVANGVYYFMMIAGRYSSTKKMILMR